MSDSETSERSGGVDIDAESIAARDVIGRDQIITQTIIQQQIVQAAPAPAEWQPAWRVLTIVARPLNVVELPNIAEVSALMRGLTEVEAPILLRFLQPPTIEALRTALADAWDVIHFDGHGAASDGGGRSRSSAKMAQSRRSRRANLRKCSRSASNRRVSSSSARASRRREGATGWRANWCAPGRRP